MRHGPGHASECLDPQAASEPRSQASVRGNTAWRTQYGSGHLYSGFRVVGTNPYSTCLSNLAALVPSIPGFHYTLRSRRSEQHQA